MPEENAYLYVEVHTYDEWFNDGPSWAIVCLSSQFIERILLMQKIVNDHKLAKVCDWSYAPYWLTTRMEVLESERWRWLLVCNAELGKEWDYLINSSEEWQTYTIEDLNNLDEEVAIEAPVLQVYDDCFSWTGYIKHTNIEVRTEMVPISMLEKHIQKMAKREEGNGKETGFEHETTG